MRGFFKYIVILLALIAAPASAQSGDQSLAFEKGGFWLDNPVTSDFALRANGYSKLRLTLYRLTDPELLTQVITARAARSLGESELMRRVTDKSAAFWQADFTINDNGAAAVVPVPADIAAGPLPSGIYVLTAEGTSAEAAPIRVAQWFMRSPLDLHVDYLGQQARMVLFDTATRLPRASTMISWLDAQGKILQQGSTDENGVLYERRPDNAVVLLAGNGNTPETASDIAFAEVPAGDAVLNHALLYPSVTDFVPGQSFNLLVVAPGLPGDGPVGLQVNKSDVQLQQLAPGLWQATITVDANQPASTAEIVLRNGRRTVAQINLPRATDNMMRVSWAQAPSNALGDRKLAYSFHLTNGAKAVSSANVALQLQPVTDNSVDSLHVAGAVPVLLPVKADKNGYSVVVDTAKLPRPAPAFYRVNVVVDGRQVGDTKMLATYPSSSWVDISPDFTDNAVAEGSTARFTVHLRDSAGGKARAIPYSWQLSRETYKFEWYQADDGRWTYRTKVDLARQLDGRVNNSNTSLALPVGAGRYRLTVNDNNGHEGELVFTAGWWLARVPPQTPEKITLKAQVEMKDGQKQLAVFIDPTFDARIWLSLPSLIGNGAAPLYTQVVDVPDAGKFIYIPYDALPKTQPLYIEAFGIPSKIGSGIVAAQGLLAMPTGMLDKKEVAVSGSKPAQLNFTDVAATSRSMLDIVDTKTNALYYRTAMQDGGTFAVPALAIDPALALRLYAVHDDRVDVAEQPLAVSGDYALDTSASYHAGSGALNVQVTSHKGNKDKLRLVLVAPSEFGINAAPVALNPLVADKAQKAMLSVGAPHVKEHLQGYGTIRLESRSGEILAARPIWLSIN